MPGVADPDHLAFWADHWSRPEEPLYLRFRDLAGETAAGWARPSLGVEPTGTIVDHESLENRVFGVEVATGPCETGGVVVKAYRPGRWSRVAIETEHDLCRRLAGEGLPVAAPEPVAGGGTLAEHEGLHVAFLRLRPGEILDSARWGDYDADRVRRVGRLVGRMHATLSGLRAPGRPDLLPGSYGRANLEVLLDTGVVPAHLRAALRDAVESVLERSEPLLEGVPLLPVHGDLNSGNIIWSEGEPLLIDFDDMLHGPAVQDLWMLVPPDSPERERRWAALGEGYGEELPFDPAWRELVPSLRCLRWLMVHVWCAHREAEEGFRRHWPDLGTEGFWRKAIDGYRGLLPEVGRTV